MGTLTLQVPNAQVGWMEQMARSMGWVFHKQETSEVKQDDATVITPAMRRSINKARKESRSGETVICRSKTEMQQFFDSL